MNRLEGVSAPCQREITHKNILHEISERQKKGEKSAVFDMRKKQTKQRKNTTKVICIKHDIIFKFDSVKTAAEHISANQHAVSMAMKRHSIINGWTIQKDV
jgi:hypothetical protein